MAKTPDLESRGKFSEQTSASRWVKPLDHELEERKGNATGEIPLANYLGYLKQLMTEDAAD